MRIAMIVMANILVAVVTVMGVNEYFGLKRFDSFTVPFTDKMVRLKVIDAKRRDGLLKEEKINHYIGMLLSVAVCAMLGGFMAGIAAAPVFVVSVAVQLAVLKPELNETESNRSRYFNTHKRDMDALKYHEYLKTAE